jgi:phage-related protein
MATELDSLVINISANVSGANEGINALRKNLSSLQNFVNKRLDTQAIDLLQEHLQRIADIDFSNVSRGLQDVVSAFRSFQNKAFMKTTQNGSNLSGMINPLLPANLSDMVDIATPNWDSVGNSYTTGFQTMKQELVEVNNQLVIYRKNINDAFDDDNGVQEEVDIFEKLRQSMEQAGFNGEQIKSVFASIRTESKVFDESSLEKLKDVFTQLGLPAEEYDRVIQHLKTDVDKTAKAHDKLEKKGKSGFQKLADAFKRVAFYRIVRRALQMIAQAIKESVQNLAKFDSAFNDSMSELKSSFTYLKNAIGSSIAPLIKAIAPLISTLTDVLADLFNMIGNLMASISGQDTFSEAIKEAEDYAESLKKVKNAQLGIDELNVIQKDKETTGYQTTQTSIQSNGAFGGLLSELKNTIDEIWNVLKPALMPVLEALANLITAIMPILNFIVQLVRRIIEKTYQSVDDSIETFIDFLAELFNVVFDILEILSPIYNFVADFVSFLLNLFNGSLDTFFTLITNVLKVVDVVLTFIKNQFEGEGVFSSILTFVKGIAETVGSKVGQTVVAATTGGGFYNLPKWEQVVLGILSGGIAPLLGLINKHANGGFVEDGLFMANHNELIGQFANGQTAVANNEQITEGIYLAVLQAMRESGGGSGKEVVINLDGKEIARTVDKYNAQKGVLMFSGGNNYGN